MDKSAPSNISNARLAEEMAAEEPADEGLYEPTFTSGSNKGKTRGGLLKKAAPTVLILSMLLGGGGLLFSGQGWQGFAMVSRFIQEGNTQGTITRIRSTYLFRRMMKVTKGNSGTVFDGDKFKLGKTQVAYFEDGNMELKDVTLEDGSTTRVLGYEQGDKFYAISADSDVKGKIKNADVVDNFGKKGSIQVMSFDTARADLPDFDTKFTAASAVWRGQSSGWYDTLTALYLTRRGGTRDLFDNFKKTGDEEVDEKNFKKISESVLKEPETTAGTRLKEETDEDGKTKTVEDSDASTKADSDKLARTDTESEIETKMNNKAAAIAKIGTQGANATCSVMMMGGMINEMAAAAEKAQIIGLASQFFEAVQKVQAGYGSGSPMLEFLNLLNQPDKKGRTGMSATGIGHVFGGKFDVTEESAKKFNIEGTKRSLLSGKIKIDGYSADEMAKCDYGRAASAGADIALESILFVSTGGMGNLALSLIETAGQIVVMEVVQQLVKAALPVLATMVTVNLISNTIGPDMGNALASGNYWYLFGNHQQGGGTGGDMAAVTAYNQATETVIAEDAEYQRRTRNPFDTSSQYTFMGSLYNNILPLAVSSDGALNLFKNLATAAFTSVGNFLPTASAIEQTKLTYEDGDCPTANSVGAAANYYCIPYEISDLSTAKTDPSSIFSSVKAANHYIEMEPDPDNPGSFRPKLDDNGNKMHHCPNFEETDYSITEECENIKLDENDNPVINMEFKEIDPGDGNMVEGGSLGRYIVFCTQRDTQYGTADANVASKLSSTGSDTVDHIITSIGNAVDIVGDIQDLMETASNEKNSGWISGRWCLQSSSNERWSGEIKYYQRYTQDQRLMTAMGVIDKSAVEVSLENYYEENPIDNSYAGIIARYSGYTKDEVLAVMDVVDRYNYVANYDATGLGPVALKKDNAVERILFYTSDLARLEMQKPLVARTAELERQIALSQYKRTVDQSI